MSCGALDEPIKVHRSWGEMEKLAQCIAPSVQRRRCLGAKPWECGATAAGPTTELLSQTYMNGKQPWHKETKAGATSDKPEMTSRIRITLRKPASSSFP